MFSSRSLCTESSTQQHKFTFTWCTYTTEFRPTRRDVRRASLSTCTRAFSDSHRKKPVLVSRLSSQTFIFFSLCQHPNAASFTRLLYHIRHTTVGGTPLDEESARRRGLYLTTQHSKQTYINASDGVRTRNLSKRTATDPRLRPPSHNPLVPQQKKNVTPGCKFRAPGLPFAEALNTSGPQYGTCFVSLSGAYSFQMVVHFWKICGPRAASHLTATLAGRHTDHNCFLSTTPCPKLFPSNKYVPNYVQVKLEMTAEPRRF